MGDLEDRERGRNNIEEIWSENLHLIKNINLYNQKLKICVSREKATMLDK